MKIETNVKVKWIKGTKGNCYQNAIRFVQANPGWKLIHGIAICTGKVRNGEPMGHAWAEKEVVIRTTLGPIEFLAVADPTKRKIVPRALYINAGRISHCVEYTLEEAYRLIKKFRHYGPWDEKIEQAEHA